MELVVLPMGKEKARAWERGALARREDWVFTKSKGGAYTSALDEVSADGSRDPAAAVVYPELHTRLVAWWLVHAWRGLDLLEDTLRNVLSWRITSAAVTARALIEEAGCLAYEASKLAEAWTVGKATPAGMMSRPASVREALNPPLTQAAFASRMQIAHEKARAVNVLTYVKKLAKATDNTRFIEWYDWLSDAAHPAFGARIAFSTPPITDPSGAYMARVYARAPLVMAGKTGNQQFDYTIACYAADALTACGRLLLELLEQSLVLVDDFGLTTAASTFTKRWYWRDFKPVRGSRPCPCGRGKWADCQHWWGAPAPVVAVSQRS